MTPDCRILHIDDNPLDLELTQMALEVVDRHVDYAGMTDAADGIASIARGEGPLPSVIVLDLNMPRMNGFEVLAAAAKTPRMQGIPIVVFTTSTNPEDHRRCRDLGARMVLEKPDGFDGMVAAGREILSLC